MSANPTQAGCPPWPIITMDDILRMHKEDTPEAPVPLWLKGACILTIVLNIVLVFFYQAKNSEAQARYDAASESLEEETRKSTQLQNRRTAAQTTQQQYEDLVEQAKQLQELKQVWHTPQQTEEGTPEHFLRQSAQNYASAIAQGRKRARTLVTLFTPSAVADVDGQAAAGRSHVVAALLNKHKQYKELRLHSVSAKNSSVLVIMSYESRADSRGYLAEALEYEDKSVSRCTITTHQDIPEIPDDYAVIKL